MNAVTAINFRPEARPGPASAGLELIFSVGAGGHPCIVPVFLPFAGCPGTCVFCAQDRQSGHKENEDDILRRDAVFARLSELKARRKSHDAAPLPELAFYGGTFTALPRQRRRFWLDFLAECRELSLAGACRCSTRPDALNGDCGGAEQDPSFSLRQLREAGMTLVELGVQSFDSAALGQARRGYSGQTAADACRAVREAGLGLGIQLLPGMPGVSPEIFLNDVEQALSLHPDCLRFYPCLVPEGTELARLWRQGDYSPWNLEDTVLTLGRALAMAWAAHVPVIRLSVAPEADFDASLLDGPRHPALGSMIQGQALLHTVEEMLRGRRHAGAQLELPLTCSGFAAGHGGALRPRWEALRVRLRFARRHDALLRLEEK